MSLTLFPRCPQLVGGSPLFAIPGAGLAEAASVYPSSITASGSNPTVHLLGFRHTWPSDVAFLLKAPNGVFCMLAANIGFPEWGPECYAAQNARLPYDQYPPTCGCSGVNLTFKDGFTPLAAGIVPLVSGTYGPVNHERGYPNYMPGHATSPTLSTIHTGQHPTSLPALSGSGPWRLYVADLVGGDGGSLLNWCISFEGSASLHCGRCGCGPLIAP